MSSNPSLHVYVALSMTSLPPRTTSPFSGGSRSGQSAARCGTSTKALLSSIYLEYLLLAATGIETRKWGTYQRKWAVVHSICHYVDTFFHPHLQERTHPHKCS